MNRFHIPGVFRQLQTAECLDASCILNKRDGFYLVYKSLANILACKNILNVPDSEGNILRCSNFFDDWFLYAISCGNEYIYSLLKLREQEHDMTGSEPADGDTPGVTVCFISFDCRILLDCLEDPSDTNRQKLNAEINRVVARRGQRHHPALKNYFIREASQGAYLAASTYVKHMAAFSQNGALEVPVHYKEIVQQSCAHKRSKKLARLPRFLDRLNREAGYTVCDNRQIFIRDPNDLTPYESTAILATHTGNTSLYSFAAEVEYHARFLTPLFKLKLPFFGRSVYDSAIRADMSVGDAEFQGTAPFYRDSSRMVKRQHRLHSGDSRI
jgi:hypothetical protein